MDPNRASKRSQMREHPNGPTAILPPGRRPRIPSLFSTLSNSKPPSTKAPNHRSAQRGRAYKPTPHPASTPDSHRHRFAHADASSPRCGLRNRDWSSDLGLRAEARRMPRRRCRPCGSLKRSRPRSRASPCVWPRQRTASAR
jgi:hypothetical protein